MFNGKVRNYSKGQYMTTLTEEVAMDILKKSKSDKKAYNAKHKVQLAKKELRRQGLRV